MQFEHVELNFQNFLKQLNLIPLLHLQEDLEVYIGIKIYILKYTYH